MSSMRTLAPSTCAERIVSRSRMLNAVPDGLCAVGASAIAWMRADFQSATNSVFSGPNANRETDLMSAADAFTDTPERKAKTMMMERMRPPAWLGDDWFW